VASVSLAYCADVDIGALDRAHPLSWRVIEISSGIGLLAGLACLLISDLCRYSMQILATSALAFGISTIYQRATAVLGGLISAAGLFCFCLSFYLSSKRALWTGVASASLCLAADSDRRVVI
jgi:hypothetical protein